MGDLFKTTVGQLASNLGVPTEIIAKPPSPDLWPNQKANEELGADYDVLDLVLWGIEHWWQTDEIASELQLSEEFVKSVVKRWELAEHKRRTPLTQKLFFRTVGHDFRLPYNP